MTALVRSAVVVVLATAVFGFAYPALMTAFASVAFPGKSTASLVHRDGRIVGSQLAAQSFTWPRYFHERPSGTAPPYNAGATTFLNLGPTSSDLAKLVAQNAAAILKLERPYNPGLTIHDIPVDAVTTSGSGIDPDISPAYAALQARRVAAVRHIPLSTVQRLIKQNTDGRSLGFFGEPGVNVLELNLALDGR
jgi:potassium-transporting ATPase KdpC subunit